MKKKMLDALVRSTFATRALTAVVSLLGACATARPRCPAGASPPSSPARPHGGRPRQRWRRKPGGCSPSSACGPAWSRSTWWPAAANGPSCSHAIGPGKVYAGAATGDPSRPATAGPGRPGLACFRPPGPARAGPVAAPITLVLQRLVDLVPPERPGGSTW